MGEELPSPPEPEDRPVALDQPRRKAEPCAAVGRADSRFLRFQQPGEHQTGPGPYRLGEVTGQLDMSSFVNRASGGLSSGQKQRANIARAFLHEPDLLILDEPTAALDVVSGQFIVETIRREKAAGRAILFSTHIMSEAEYLCDRIVLLHQGRTVDEGTLPELIERAGARILTDAFLKNIGAGAIPGGGAQ